jgi:hypothetical protein
MVEKRWPWMGEGRGLGSSLPTVADRPEQFFSPNLLWLPLYKMGSGPVNRWTSLQLPDDSYCFYFIYFLILTTLANFSLRPVFPRVRDGRLHYMSRNILILGKSTGRKCKAAWWSGGWQDSWPLDYNQKWPVILATQEAQLRRTAVRSQHWQIVHETQSQKKKKKNPSQKRAGGVAQRVGPGWSPSPTKKKQNWQED